MHLHINRWPFIVRQCIWNWERTGLPGETDETIEETAKWMKELPSDSWGVHIFVPLPGSPIWLNPERFDFEFNRSDVYDYYHTIGKPDEWQAHHLHKNPDQVKGWANYLRDVARNKNIDQFDARLHETAN